ncbi:MAG: serine/threonine-protein kinase, partial [Leptolyngbyaceae bacterium]|nr:serine/threonine-protein kinase [Leptolyngbyaceae bacterium]
EGQNLADELSQFGPWDEEKGRSLLVDLLPVLQFIHHHQVIHRDIKPENIIRSAANGTLTLVDFGAAKQTSRTQIASSDIIIGSAEYAAPEQTLGQAIFASDIYSLGVTCLHLLTGEHPFDLYSVSQDDWVWSQYVTVPPSVAFSQILNRMVCRSVNQRYRNVAAILTDLQAVPALPPPPPPVKQPHQGNPNPLWQIIQRVTPAPVPSTNLPPWQAFTRSPHRPLAATANLATDAVLPPTPTPSPSDRLPNTHAHTFIQSQGITTLAINGDGSILASGGNQGAIALWHLPSATRWHEFPAHSLWQRDGHRDRITALQFSPDGSTLFSSSADSTIKQWDVNQPRLHQTLTGEGWGIASLVLHPDGEVLFSGGTNGAIDLWNVPQGQFIQRLWHHTDTVTRLGLGTAATILWSGSADGQIYGWDLGTAEAIAAIPAHYQGVSALAHHPQGRILITSGGDRTLRVWDIPSLRLLRTVTMNLGSGSPLALHPSGRWLATAWDETHLHLWQLEISPPHVIRLSPRCQLDQDWTLSAMVFSPRGDRLVSGSEDGTIKVWQPQPSIRKPEKKVGN